MHEMLEARPLHLRVQELRGLHDQYEQQVDLQRSRRTQPRFYSDQVSIGRAETVNAARLIMHSFLTAE